MRRTAILVFVLLILAGFINYFVYETDSPLEVSRKMRKANEAYVKGEMATDVEERRVAFNEALGLFLGLAVEYDPSFGNGHLYYNIANSYFQLREYPWAILYYYRALALMPRNDSAKYNLSLAKVKLGLDGGQELVGEGISARDSGSSFYWYSYSIPERIQQFVVLCVMLFLFGSLYIWFRHRLFWVLTKVFAFLVVLVLFSLAMTQYFSPIGGVIVKSSFLYRDAGMQYAKVAEEPVPSGELVEVLDVLQGGKWVKVMAPGGKLGFVPEGSIRLVR